MTTYNSSIGDLGDPQCYREPVDLTDVPREQALGFLRDMLVIRLAEEGISDLAKSQAAKTPCHLGIGQEAVAVGISAGLVSSDRVFGGHRSHPHYLALGGDLDALLAEVLGKAAGASNGMGGSMHLYASDIGFHGSVPIVGATIPIAVGAALASKMDQDGSIAVCYFGDGACEEGVFHESLNLAAVQKLPVLFVCENNLFSSHLDIKDRQPGDRVARFADAHCVASSTVDGNDVVAMRNSAQRHIAQLRAGNGPAMIEAVTYRHRGHVGPNEDIDVGVRRSLSELEDWKARDPVRRLHDSLVAREWMDQDQFEALNQDIADRVRAASEKAVAGEYPPTSNLLGMVYAGDAS